MRCDVILRCKSVTTQGAFSKMGFKGYNQVESGGTKMSGFQAEKMTAYLDSLLELGIPSVDCIVYQDHKQIYRHMNGTVDIAKTKPVQEDTRYSDHHIVAPGQVKERCLVHQIIQCIRYIFHVVPF